MSQATSRNSTAAAVLSAPSRRSLVGAGAAFLLGGAAAAGFVKPEPLPWRNGPRPKPAPVPGDAALIADCQAFIALERRVGALYSGPGRVSDEDERDEALERPVAQQRPLLDRICDTPATTPEGARAKAAALAAWAPDQLKPRDGACWDERLLASLLADLTGRVPT